MISSIRLLRNIGQFDSVSDGAQHPFSKLTLVYAENARGKTTLAAVLRSVGTGDPLPITERHRLSAQHAPYVVLDTGGGSLVTFQNGGWTGQLPDVAVFDDIFVDQNVYSGLVVGAEHRQHLHELILGAQGVALNRSLQELVDRVEEHNKTLRAKADAIRAGERGTLSADDFCGLTDRPQIDAELQAAERSLAAAREQDSIRNASGFDSLELPPFDMAALPALLARGLADLDTTAAARVQAHIVSLGADGEEWVADGMRHLSDSASDACPFCAQDLRGSSLIDHYRAYFSAAYDGLKQNITGALSDIDARHGGQMPAGFERSVRVWVERRLFWSKFCDAPEVSVDTATIARAWTAARLAVQSALRAKQAAPLEKLVVPAEAGTPVAAFNDCRQQVEELNGCLQRTNEAIRLVKEQAASGNPTALAADVSRLKAVKARHSPATAALCDDYLAEKTAKAATDKERDKARAALDQYRKAIFPACETAINEYLRRFNAGFRLADVASANTRGGSSATYKVLINVGTANVAVPVAGAATPGAPSFRNTLSAGDRNTLALAFFFASLEQDPGLAKKTVVIDDPITSLDEHRSLTTVQEVRKLAASAAQIIVLSHSKPFLCRIWEGAEKGTGAAVQIGRGASGSTIDGWVIHHDLVTDHDRRHALFREFIAGGERDSRKVAQALRPTLEAFMRVAYPEPFPPGALLGPFINVCEQRLGTPQQILVLPHIRELKELLEYGNLFHHDSNLAWETEIINDAQLLGFVCRTLDFTRR